ncbi:phage major tail protein, TP901-1 family [Tautonia plasticadhaerens]|uniref:Phage major tail protein 2 n=1 Tax=Tautonia plasticadhaerens TaxID=2527974 RepID=A0A518H241_9BACT|nr:phage major tail protein, TP901-1 family [Tautonia plasticadhaerens]QDV34902.1 Phage major tail protein 2 [Tautonia plasticadhaerens]
MALQKGRDMLIKLGDAATGTTIGGLTDTSITMGNNVVDGSTKDTNGWRELVEDASLKSFSIACSGFFKDSATDESIRAKAFAGTIDTYTLVFPNGDTIEGDFLIAGYTRNGAKDGVEQYSYTLESHGEPTFTAAA